MKTRTLILAVLLTLVAGLQAQQTSTKQITAVDTAKNTVTLSDQSHVKTYNLAMMAEVTINGAKATVGELAVGMRVLSLSLADSTTIRKLEAFNLPVSAQTGPKKKSPSVPPPPTAPILNAEADELTKKLPGTFWKRNEDPKGWVCLNANGTATAGWHNKQGSWEVVGKLTILLKITSKAMNGAAPGEILTLNPELTKAGGYPRIDSPTQAMLDRVASLSSSTAPQSSPSSSPAPGSANYFGTKDTTNPSSVPDSQ